LKTKSKEKVLKEDRKKQYITYREMPIQMPDFTSKTRGQKEVAHFLSAEKKISTSSNYASEINKK
jgi:hypothetical protein